MNSLWLRVGAPLTFTVNCAMAMGTHLAKLISFIIANVSDVNSPPHSSGKHFPVPYIVTVLCTCFFKFNPSFIRSFFHWWSLTARLYVFQLKPSLASVACRLYTLRNWQPLMALKQIYGNLDRTPILKNQKILHDTVIRIISIHESYGSSRA